MLSFIWAFIKDHWSQITITNRIIVKKFEIFRELTKIWHRHRKWANAIGKMVPLDLLDTGLLQTFHLFKKKRKKEKQYLRSVIKRGMPVIDCWGWGGWGSLITFWFCCEKLIEQRVVIPVGIKIILTFWSPLQPFPWYSQLHFFSDSSGQCDWHSRVNSSGAYF